jgi:hypothetical protein
MGILCFGMMLFFLAGMQSASFESFLYYLFRDASELFYGFLISLIAAATFLSIDQKNQ